MRREGGRGIERAWGISNALLAALLGLLFSFSLSQGGLGLSRLHGRYVLHQGARFEEINQALGFILNSIQWSVVALFVIYLLLSIAVYGRNGSLKPKVVLMADKEEPIRFALAVSSVFFFVAVLLGVVVFWATG